MVWSYVFSDFIICKQTTTTNNICGFQKILWELYEGNYNIFISKRFTWDVENNVYIYKDS